MKPALWRIAFTLALPTALAAAAPQPTVAVCMLRHSDTAQAARYRVTIDWNGFGDQDTARIDLAAEDASGDIWPQFRDQRLKPQTKPTVDIITVSDVSRYPLNFYLVGLNDDAVAAFDDECRAGFCSVKASMPGIEQLGTGASIPAVVDAYSCPKG
ncbi:hypothetical protein [Sphingomonas crocodyli]|uniref:Uncharacterized protein n=1 Tax=Sphingomonas crocodyli TaxID=1979270 RepID=A0A437M7J2_9SPHN|nr:hypothetical protein [Sphingomonas crocodyli]RVT93464.1 hypothetical protein EOD43_06195 [Sphingomonas crocodyli]